MPWNPYLYLPLELVQEIVDSFFLVVGLERHDVLPLGSWHPQVTSQELPLLRLLLLQRFQSKVVPPRYLRDQPSAGQAVVRVGDVDMKLDLFVDLDSYDLPIREAHAAVGLHRKVGVFRAVLTRIVA